MTQPAAEQPRRIPLDDLTSDQLDQLYARAEQADATIQHLREQHVKILRERIKTSMAETAGWKAAWQLAHDRSAKHRERADEAEADLRVTNINLKNERGHNLSIQHDYHHALTDVYAMQRVRAVAHRWASFRPYDDAAAELREAIGTPDTCRGRGKCTWMEPNSTDRERADRAEKRLALARAEAQEWHTHFLDSGDAPATHALAMVLLLLDQQQGKT